MERQIDSTLFLSILILFLSHYRLTAVRLIVIDILVYRGCWSVYTNILHTIHTQTHLTTTDFGYDL